MLFTRDHSGSATEGRLADSISDSASGHTRRLDVGREGSLPTQPCPPSWRREGPVWFRERSMSEERHAPLWAHHRAPWRSVWAVLAADAHVMYQAPKHRPVPDLPLLPCQWGLAFHPLGIRVLLRTDAGTLKSLYVRRRGGELALYRPLEVFDALFAVFANLRTPGDVLFFTERFGPLTRDGEDARYQAPHLRRRGASPIAA